VLPSKHWRKLQQHSNATAASLPDTKGLHLITMVVSVEKTLQTTLFHAIVQFCVGSNRSNLKVFRDLARPYQKFNLTFTFTILDQTRPQHSWDQTFGEICSKFDLPLSQEGPGSWKLNLNYILKCS
jgi:hypothetical protein